MQPSRWMAEVSCWLNSFTCPRTRAVAKGDDGQVRRRPNLKPIYLLDLFVEIAGEQHLLFQCGTGRRDAQQLERQPEAQAAKGTCQFG